MAHDPRQFVSMLRDNLAAHDKQILFLFGAGTSCSINVAPPAVEGQPRSYEPLIPGVEALTEICRNEVATSPEFLAAWEGLVRECQEFGQPSHIEGVLTRVRHKLDAMGKSDSAFGMRREQIEQIELSIRTTIVRATSPDESSIPADVPHHSFARWVKNGVRRNPVEIFTTNYDILFERSLERSRVPVFDGFVGSYEPFFHPDSVNDEAYGLGQKWTKLWKLHGSINWEIHQRSVVRIAGGAGGDMILPSQRKYDESRKLPYLALLDRFARAVSRESALLVTCGYSWGDDHINDVILRVLDENPASHAVALMYADPTADAPLAAYAADRRNLLVAWPSEATIGGNRQRWQLPADVDLGAALLRSAAVSIDRRPPEDGGIMVRVQLGDFEAFCGFLAEMDSRFGVLNG